MDVKLHVVLILFLFFFFFFFFFFANNCFLYFKATKVETCTIKQTLLEDDLALGQKVNFNKSSITFGVRPSIYNVHE